MNAVPNMQNDPSTDAPPRPVKTSSPSTWRMYVNRLIAGEISSFSRYFDLLVQWRRREFDTGILFEAVDCPEKLQATDTSKIPLSASPARSRTLILINGNLNHDFDIQ